jgi:hypothetical protein
VRHCNGEPSKTCPRGSSQRPSAPVGGAEVPCTRASAAGTVLAAPVSSVLTTARWTFTGCAASLAAADTDICPASTALLTSGWASLRTFCACVTRLWEMFKVAAAWA